MNARQSLYLVIIAAALYAAWEIIAHNYLMFLPMPTWHWVSGGVGMILALALAAVASQALLKHEKQMKELAQLKDDLTRMVVQDLRSPLMAIIGALETLKIGIRPDISPESKEMIDMALAGNRALFGMTSDLLDISSMEEGKYILDHSETEIAPLAISAIDAARPEAKAREVLIVDHVDLGIPPVMLDGGKMRRVISHLLMNALKFTHFGGWVELTVRWDASSQQLTVEVSDNGAGIAPEHRDKVFGKFFRVKEHQGDRVFSSGLGLAYCKLIAEEHGGSIEVESAVGRGSLFRVRIPAPKAAAAAERAYVLGDQRPVRAS